MIALVFLVASSNVLPQTKTFLKSGEIPTHPGLYPYKSLKRFIFTCFILNIVYHTAEKENVQYYFESKTLTILSIAI